MKNNMNCPKCGEPMVMGEMVNLNGKGSLLWTPKGYLDSKICNMFTKRDAIKAGCMSFSLGNGVTNNRATGYVCKQCKLVLVDCNDE